MRPSTIVKPTGARRAGNGDNEVSTRSCSGLEAEKKLKCTRCRNQKKKCFWATGSSPDGPCEECRKTANPNCSGLLSYEDDTEHQTWKRNKEEKKRDKAANPSRGVRKRASLSNRNAPNGVITGRHVTFQHQSNSVLDNTVESPRIEEGASSNIGADDEQLRIKEDFKEERELLKEVFSWLMVGFITLTLTHLIEILKLKRDAKLNPSLITDVDISEYKTRIKKACSNYVTWSEDDGNVIRFTKNGFTRYLQSGGDNNPIFRLSAAEAHETVAMTCINYLRNADLLRDASDGLQSSLESQRRTVARYMIQNMVRHSLAADNDTSSVPGFLWDFMRRDKVQFNRFCQLYDVLSGSLYKDEPGVPPMKRRPKVGYILNRLNSAFDDMEVGLITLSNSPQSDGEGEEMDSAMFRLIQLQLNLLQRQQPTPASAPL